MSESQSRMDIPQSDSRSGRAPAQSACEAIETRHSMRAFLPDPVDPDLVRRLLQVASRAPSGTNTQPWKVYVLTGDVKDRLCAEILTAFDAGEEHRQEYKYYPDTWREPYISRRRANGWGLYGLLGIQKGDRDRMHDQHGRNFTFFDAPVGFIFTVDRDMEIGSWLDYGMFIQSIMVAARDFGLDTCAQGAFAPYHTILQQRLSIPAEEMVICGMALGYADMSKVENSLVTDREPIEAFTTYVTELA